MSKKPSYIEQLENAAAHNAQQDVAISDAQSSADAKVSALEALLRDLIEDEKATLETQIQNTVPAGTVVAFAGNYDVAGFLLCNGAAVSRTTYAALFSAIGTTYGAGDGWSTFNLPNLEDRFIQGKWQSGYYLEAGLPDHNHRFPHTQSQFYASYGYEVFYTTRYRTDGDADKQYLDVAVNSLGYASASNGIYGRSGTVQPPALTMRYCIKY